MEKTMEKMVFFYLFFSLNLLNPVEFSLMGAFDNTLGVTSIGYFIAAVLFGILNIQSFRYFEGYTKDWMVIKFVDTEHTSNGFHRALFVPLDNIKLRQCNGLLTIPFGEITILRICSLEFLSLVMNFK
ncbi:hypothetical protein BT96DRAFT_942518 [Gymnopus androsaceus JB14]|uniref:Uncharacterized protein n=1 Tax=Gymnopus androsaceus JB14 TaxID=1447944 RepID=A0A6A4HAR1_9AGAR|nr:hypothetical protein BT96DRAFT_942518 [Gymnopus androsaceus JB14]